eukprot:UN13247
MYTSLSNGIIVKASKNKVFDSAKAPREKVIGVDAYFIYQSDSRTVVLTAVNYSDSLRVSHELVDDMDPSLRND